MRQVEIFIVALYLLLQGVIFSLGLESVFDESQSQPGLKAEPVNTSFLNRGPQKHQSGFTNLDLTFIRISSNCVNREVTELV